MGYVCAGCGDGNEIYFVSLVGIGIRFYLEGRGMIMRAVGIGLGVIFLPV